MALGPLEGQPQDQGHGQWNCGNCDQAVAPHGEGEAEHGQDANRQFGGVPYQEIPPEFAEGTHPPHRIRRPPARVDATGSAPESW